jgi:hypothetical protein
MTEPAQVNNPIGPVRNALGLSTYSRPGLKVIKRFMAVIYECSNTLVLSEHW